MNVLPFSLRHLAKTPPYFPMSGLCMDLRRFLGDHASGWLGKLCPRAVWDFVHIGLVASTSLCVRTELRHVHPVLLPRTPGWHHCLLLCHDHLQGEVLFKRSFPLWRSHQKQPQPWDQTYKGNKGFGLKVAKKKVIHPNSLRFISGGNADLCRLLDSLDPIRSGFSGFCVWWTGFHSHSCVCHPHIIGQIFSDVQPYHLPACGLKKLMLNVLF